jgi:hypothetical protein
VPNEDVYANAWALAWVVHQSVHEPRHLFQANIFQPHTLSLAYAESLLPQALQSAPLFLLGGGPLLAHNIVFLLTFPLGGLGAYLLARDVSGSRAGAFLAGLGYAFCAFRYDHVVHLQTLSVQWFPFVLLYLRRAWEGGRLRHLSALFVFAILQALSSGYMAVLLAAMLAVALGYQAVSTRLSGHPWRVGLALGLAAAVCLAAFLPYREIGLRHHIQRKRQEVVHWSARPESYLDPGRYSAWPHVRGLAGLTRTGEPLYPGLPVLVLGAAGLAVGARRPGPERLLALLAATGAMLSFGPEVRIGSVSMPGPFEALRFLPGAAMVRMPSRFGVLAILALDVLAAVGWAEGTRRLTARARAVAWSLLAAFMSLEPYPSGLSGQIRPVPPPPPAAHWLADAPRGLVLELPWNHPQESGLYEYWSTVHWQPMVNGYGGFDPPGNFALGLVGAQWPAPYASRMIRESGVRYVVVHLDRLTEPRRQRIRSFVELPEGVRLAATIGEDRIYELPPETSSIAPPTAR